MSELKDLIEYISKKLVDYPEKVVVTEVVHENTTVISLDVDKADRGKVIGKKGETAKAMRKLLTVTSAKHKRRSHLDIVE